MDEVSGTSSIILILLKSNFLDLIFIFFQASSTYGLRFVSNNTSKRSQKESKKGSQKDSQQDSQKDTQKDSHKDSHKDSQIDNHKDSQKDSQKDSRKDLRKDSQEISSPAPCNRQIGGGHCFTVSYDFLYSK